MPYEVFFLYDNQTMIEAFTASVTQKDSSRHFLGSALALLPEIVLTEERVRCAVHVGDR